MDFQVWDFPGQLDFLDPAFDAESIFGAIGALIWVIDAQDDYLDAINRLNATILRLQQSYPTINVEVFIHKVDGLSDDYKFDIQRDIIQRIQDELSDAGYENTPISYHLTSIYDHSIFEAFSKVCQKLITQLPALEGLLNLLCANCHMDKAFLFDVLSKIYIATDTSPVDMPSYEVCSDYIDVIVDVSEVYGWDRPKETLSEEREEPCPEAESTILLMEGKYIYLREINKSVAPFLWVGKISCDCKTLTVMIRYLALICLMKDECEKKKGLIDYDVNVIQNALSQVFGYEQ